MSFDTPYSRQVVSPSRSQDDSFMKKVVTFFFGRLFSKLEEGNVVSKLYRQYAASFVVYFNSKTPLRVPLFNMSSTQDGSKDGWSYQSVRQIVGLDSSQECEYDGLDAALKDNFDQQTEVSSNMLEMVRSLKSHSMEANNLIKRDIKRLDLSKNTAEGNMDALKKNSEKLADCTRDGMNWCLIVLVVVVFIIFMFMVFLMRVLKKN